MTQLGECPYVEHLPIEWSGNVRIMTCRSVSGSQKYEKYQLPLNFNNTDDWLYLNDRYTACTCASSLCSWFECDDFSASQYFRILNAMPNIEYSVILSYPVSTSVLNGCCLDINKFNESFSAKLCFDASDIHGSDCGRYAEFSLRINESGNVESGEFSPDYFIGKYGGASGLRIVRGGLEIDGFQPCSTI